MDVPRKGNPTMKKMLLATFALAALALLMPSTSAAQGEGLNANIFGIYTDESASANYYEGTGSFTAYALCINPVNYNYGGTGAVQDINNLGGFEFKVNTPATCFLIGSTLHASATNFMSPPDFYVGCWIPAIDRGDFRTVTLVTLNFLDTAGSGEFFLSPVSSNPSIADKMALTDAEDGFRLNPAYPPYHNYNIPVFNIGGPVDSETSTWGDIKSMYR
jgi:hypothetical protein